MVAETVKGDKVARVEKFGDLSFYCIYNAVELVDGAGTRMLQFENRNGEWVEERAMFSELPKKAMPFNDWPAACEAARESLE